jgi:hypothetical protein
LNHFDSTTVVAKLKSLEKYKSSVFCKKIKLKELTSMGHFSALDHLIKSTQSLQWHAALGADFGARNFPVTLPQGHFIVPSTMTLSSFEVDRKYPTTANRTAEPPTAIPTGAERRNDMMFDDGSGIR